MAYIFHERELPKLLSVVPGRERTLFVNQELAETDDLLAGVMRYKAGAESPYHYHQNCEHFYFMIEGAGTVETPEGVTSVKAGDLIFIPDEGKHRFRATEDVFLFEFQAPNRFKTIIVEGSEDGIRWERIEGKVRIQVKYG